MTYRLISDLDSLAPLTEALASVSRIALDLEAAGFHRYSDQLCLVQLSTESETVLLDPLSVDLSSVLREPLESPDVTVVMHGSDYDVRLLDRDLDIHIQGLFDTQTAASLLGASAIGLASLLEEHFGVKLSKKHQRADWAQRPLQADMLEYAASDTSHLLELASRLTRELEERGRLEWAREEFLLLEGIRWEEEEVDPVTRVKGARDLTARGVTQLRAALAWRDRIAKERDRAPFRVAGEPVLLAVVLERPDSVEALADLKGVSPQLARQHGAELLGEFHRIDALPEDSLQPYPRPPRNGFPRPTPEEEALAARIRDARTAQAQELELDRGVLLSNAQIGAIVRGAPADEEALSRIPGLRRWQLELLSPELLKILT